MLIDDVAQALGRHGLRLGDGFRPDAVDRVPPLPDGRPVRAVLMIGNAGLGMWRRFSDELPAGPSPLDAWTRRVLTPVAERFDACVVYPFQLPFLPFQQWTMRAEPCHVSPLRMLIHPVFGLWHACRGALLFAGDIGLPDIMDGPSPCESCVGRPCLSMCPVGAFAADAYDAVRCLDHLDVTDGEDCVALGCRARRACPVGSEYRYEPGQARFHMEAFRAYLPLVRRHSGGRDEDGEPG